MIRRPPGPMTRASMQRAGENAAKVCAFLKDHPKVESVGYLGFLEGGSRQADIYNRHCKGAGSTFSLYLKGGEKEAFAFLDALKIAHLAVSLGGTETLASAPAAMIGEIGEWIAESGRTIVGLLGFFGATLVGMANVISHPKRFRLNAVVQRFDVVGVRALGIIGLMSFLIGIVIAQQGAVQLQQFGAEIYTINLIGRITVRELGTLMTAIMSAEKLWSRKTVKPSFRLSWNQSRQVTRLPDQLWKYSCATTAAMASKSASVAISGSARM